MSTPQCSVILCTRDRRAVAERCLAALALLDHPSYEVVVVDNTRGDAAVERIAARAGARYVVAASPGLSRARNTGARAARGAIVAYTDDDAVPEPGWLRHHAAALAADASLSATTGRVLAGPDGSPAAAAYAQVGGEDLGELAFRVDRSAPGWFERANFGGIGVGPNLAFRRELFQRGWGFPERLGPGAGIAGEEHYALFTLVREGHAVAYLPDAVVHHDARPTLEAIEQRKRAIVRHGAAYLTMLLVEERGFRRDTLRYALGGLRGGSRAWRPPGAGAPFLDRSSLLRAAAGGPGLYLRSRRAHRGRVSASSRVAPAGAHPGSSVP